MIAMYTGIYKNRYLRYIPYMCTSYTDKNVWYNVAREGPAITNVIFVQGVQFSMCLLWGIMII